MNSKGVKKHVLFIQGAGRVPITRDEKLVASRRHLLGPSYEVRYPLMQNEDDANYMTWVCQSKVELGTFNDGVILVGHYKRIALVRSVYI